MIHSDWQPARIKSRNSLLKLSEAKEIFAPTDCVHTFPQLSHHSSDSRHVKHGFLLVHKPTLNSHSQTYPNLCRSPTLNRASLKKNLRCRFFFFMNLCSWSNGRIFSLEGCIGAPAMWVCTKHHRRAALCFPTVILLFQLKQSAGHCLENSHLPRLCGQCLKMKVSIQRDFSAAW